jgi:hypothetical protein
MSDGAGNVGNAIPAIADFATVTVAVPVDLPYVLSPLYATLND